MATTPELVGWASQLMRKQLVPKPRTSPDQIPAAREMWRLENLPHLAADLPELSANHYGIVLRRREGADLTADVHVPEGEGPFPTLVYLHGGSWVLWSAAHLRKQCMQIAQRGFVVINVEYGLAPEHPWPWAVEDALYAMRWASQNAERYGGRSTRLYVGGDSAGANLTAAAICALKGDGAALDEGDLTGVPVDIAGALLLCGVFDFPLLFAEPRSVADTGFIETTWNLAYLGSNFVGVHRHPLVSPAYSSVLVDFPPVYINCGDCDALVPQSLRFAKCLIDAGVPTTLSIVENADHEFLLIPEFVPAAAGEFEHIISWIRLQEAKVV